MNIPFVRKRVGVNSRKRVGIMLHHGLGDLLMAKPLMDVLLRAEKVEHLVVAVRDRKLGETLEMMGYHGQVLYTEELGTRAVAAQFRRDCVDALLLPQSFKPLMAGLFAVSTGATLRVGPSGAAPLINRAVPSPETARKHKVEVYLDYARAIGVPVSAEAPDVTLPGLESIRARGMGLLEDLRVRRQFVAICPGSAPKEKHKRWPATQFASLIDGLAMRHPNLSVVIFGGPAEHGLVTEIMERQTAGMPATSASPRTPSELMCLLSLAKCVVAPCNGLAHAAAAVGVPVIGVFGPTNPIITGPFTRQLWVVRNDLPCNPCYNKDFSAGCGTPVCMSQLPFAPVLDALLACLRGEPAPSIKWRSLSLLRKPSV